jgi:DNA-binding NarL/FixJ family response regulator
MTRADAAIERLLPRRQDGETQMPGMIFLDPGMMENNGLDFILAMKAGRDTRSVPIVVFADSDYPPEMPALIDAGAVEYLLARDGAAIHGDGGGSCAALEQAEALTCIPASAGKDNAGADRTKAGGDD